MVVYTPATFINNFSFLNTGKRKRKRARVFLVNNMQKKIKGLMPSLKEKKRYLAIKINTFDDQKIYSTRPMNELVEKMKSVLGVFGSAEAGLMPVNFDSTKNIAIIRSSNKMIDKVKASLIFINELGTQQVILSTIKVSGMINKVKNM